MRRIETRDDRDPSINLALEEWCVRNLDPEPGYLLLYVNDPAIVVGKNQNVYLEADVAWARARGIPVLRRISGGGTVYHDPGNLNFSFLRKFDLAEGLDYDAFLEPVARALRAIGLPVERNRRNDLVLHGRKVSGNAQFTSVRSMFSHGTLLFDACLDDVRDSLRVTGNGIETRAVRSVRSPVTNLRPHLSRPMDLAAFRERLAHHLLGVDPPASLRLGDDAWDAIERLAETRYRSWDWTYGRAPRFRVRRDLGTPERPVEVVLDVEHGVVSTARVPRGGDARRIGHLVAHLTGVRYCREDLHRALTAAGADPALDGADAATLAARLHD